MCLENLFSLSLYQFFISEFRNRLLVLPLIFLGLATLQTLSNLHPCHSTLLSRFVMFAETLVLHIIKFHRSSRDNYNLIK